MKLTKTAFQALATILLVTSCTVKEDRMPCPCYIEFEALPGLEYKQYDSFCFVCLDQNSRAVESVLELPWHQAIDGTHDVKVAKGIKSLSAIQGLNRSYMQGNSVIIPLGEQADSLSCFTVTANCYREKYLMQIDSTKHFATVTVKVAEDGRDDYPYILRVRGDVNGYDIRSMAPIEGDFRYVPKINRRNEFIFRLPRQFPKDGTLYLDICDRLNFDTNPHVLASIRLGELIDRAGYDWTRPCLQDIDIKLTYSITHIQISITDWHTIIYSEEV